MEHIKLSTLIREGAKLNPQARFYYRDYAEGGLCTCAIGAALEYVKQFNVDEFGTYGGIGFLDTIIGYSIHDTLIDRYDLLTLGLGEQTSIESVHDVISYMNDSMLWSRETIADWLEEGGY